MGRVIRVLAIGFLAAAVTGRFPQITHQLCPTQNFLIGFGICFHSQSATPMAVHLIEIGGPPKPNLSNFLRRLALPVSVKH